MSVLVTQIENHAMFVGNGEGHNLYFLWIIWCKSGVKARNCRLKTLSRGRGKPLSNTSRVKCNLTYKP